ncbi:MAG: leucyl/phenylalanyl-tRNA--protein transferase [Bacteroidetes bacterium]|nr:leucyl/phenylalanyl-tRNA--protein transferase [Bacteroidota bacterium]
MPIYWLTEQLSFPPIEGAENGIVAVGGDLSPERLLLAYHKGIFPWYSEGEPIVWHAPENRFILFLDDFHVSKSLKKVLKKQQFSVTIDTNFDGVIRACAHVKRLFQNGTWITNDMINAYNKLHQLGYAHSVEVWQNKQMVGGIYGVSLGKCFFGESMFHTVTNASKVAMFFLVELLKDKNFHFLDAQVHTEHVAQFGAKEIPRNEFTSILEKGLIMETWKGKWHF